LNKIKFSLKKYKEISIPKFDLFGQVCKGFVKKSTKVSIKVNPECFVRVSSENFKKLPPLSGRQQVKK
jgi:hypothetical protein